jgi:peptidase E
MNNFITANKGTIVLMGSGELTSTMVEVHKDLLARLGPSARAVFLDTPAGFQLNADQLSQRAVEYFKTHVHRELEIASLKSYETGRTFGAEKAFQTLRAADFVLIGPGSPTYAVRQWRQSPVPDILHKRIGDGACLIAASAAALTVGSCTLPVYEIYKVGDDLHWVEGLNLLGQFGIKAAVIPHWNNAEGGTHDTRFCYMGEPRFRQLENMLPPEALVIGLDEHTACIMDLERDEACVRGIGRVIVRTRTMEAAFSKGERFSLGLLRGETAAHDQRLSPLQVEAVQAPIDEPQGSFWQQVHALQDAFRQGLEENSWEETTGALLSLDDAIWKASEQGESEEFISQAREALRDMLADLGKRLGAEPAGAAPAVAPLVDGLVALRARLRNEKKWQEADALRLCLEQADIMIEDSKDGPRWHMRQ